ncbi:type I-B CRISPR-associated protein Cas5b [Desulfallas thermosapovorans]|uniref:CRISPR-associated Cas5h family protein n=1 Tax=Desulfallas thermosapovorans DSM 6562 TaxID=1121431 RepID=A0A5S4ZMP9_9FIRM|nr:type I-B CRISPR-associated protein Cas5b [Desulfallas thermosapovorans]TYO92776.1 CRISPR-associated Cas5h family protein [Desulfallas thermosapovorans DSM 6562]
MTLVFEIASNLAMFRKGYTTTSMISYPFLTPTAAAGVIAAIVGIDNGAGEKADAAAYWQKFNGTQVAISVRAPLAWYLTAVNLIKFKNGNGDMREHIQPKHQFIKNPRYRVYVRGGDLYRELKARLERNECVFTPYLGVAYAIADISYIGEFAEEETTACPVAVNTIMPLAEGLALDINKSGAVFKEHVPLVQDTERSFIKSVPVLYSGRAATEAIYIKEKGSLELSMVGGEQVAWFEAWSG